jgi:hypothetical protein
MLATIHIQRSGAIAIRFIIAVFVLVLCVKTAIASDAAKPVWFAPDGCEFAIAFPEAPQVVKQYVEGAGYLTTASGGVKGDLETTVVMVAEAASFNPGALDGIDQEAYLIERGLQYAEFNGLEHVEYNTERIAGSPAITIRGGKTVGGVRVIYLCRAVLGTRSVLMVRAGGAATSFPQPGLLQYVNSIRRQ